VVAERDAVDEAEGALEVGETVRATAEAELGEAFRLGPVQGRVPDRR
jgi:hypothetical protein